MSEFDKAMRGVRSASVSVMAISAVTSVLMLALPFYMMQVFIRVLPSRSMETLIALSVLALIAFVAFGIFDALRQAILVRAAARYEALLSGPIVYAHFLDGSREPSAGSELIADVRQVRAFLGSRAPAAIAEAPFIPIFLLVIFLVDIWLGILILVGMGLMVLLAVLQQSAMQRGVEQQNEAQRQSNRLLQSHIDQAELVRVLGLQKTAIDRWGEWSAKNLSGYVDLQTTGGTFGGLSKVLRFGLQAAILGVGAFQAIRGEVSPIVVFAAMMIGGRALAPLDGLVGSWSALTTALEAHKRVKAAMAEFSVRPDPTTLPEPQGEIRVEKLVYGTPGGNGEAIIKRISFGVPPKSCVGIIGPSGAGKSTLLRLLSGAIEPNGGHVRLDGADLRNWNKTQLGPHVGYVPQAIDFLPGTVAQNIARFDEQTTDEAIITAAKQAGVHEMILRFPNGYDTMLGSTGFRPSGGQKQLLAIARALYGEPKILFLDEPNSNLDQAGDAILLRALQGATKRGATIILVTQRPVLLQAADRVLVLRDGMIEDYGPKAEVLAKLQKQPAKAVAPPAKAVPGPQAAAPGQAVPANGAQAGAVVMPPAHAQPQPVQHNAQPAQGQPQPTRQNAVPATVTAAQQQPMRVAVES